MLDKDQIRISQFNGLYDRAVDLEAQPQILEEIPFGYARDVKNIIPSERGIQNRQQCIFHEDKGATVNDIYYLRAGHVYSRGVNGDLYASGNLVLAAFAGTKRLSLVQRIFISTGSYYDCLVTATQGGQNALLVRSDTGANRLAAGAPPASAPTAANGAAGRVELGTHLISVAYETDSGFITRYRIPATVYVAPGALAINLTVIPTGPAGTIARHIVASKVIREFNGDTAAYEMFFVPGGRIADNVTTILTINFYDTELLATADDLNDLESVLLSYVYLATYHNRAVYLKFDPATQVGAFIVLSLPGSFESVTLVDGVLSNSSMGGALSAFVYQDNLYVMTTGGQTYLFRDNGGPPNTWQGNIISSEVRPLSMSAIGKVPICAVNPNGDGANQLDYNIVENSAIIGAKGGIYGFNGDFSVRPLTWNIDRLWRELIYGVSNIDQIKIVIDPDKKLIYVLGFLFCTSPNLRRLILVGDYSEGLNWKTIKWFPYFFPFDVKTGDILGDVTTSGQHSLIFTGDRYTYMLPAIIGTYTDNRDEDNSSGVIVKVPIPCVYETGILPQSDSLDDVQNGEIRLNQRFEDHGGALPQQTVQLGFGLSGVYRNYLYTLGDKQIQTFNINLPSNRETFKWSFSTQEATTYRAIELLDILIFSNVRAATRVKK